MFTHLVKCLLIIQGKIENTLSQWSLQRNSPIIPTLNIKYYMCHTTDMNQMYSISLSDLILLAGNNSASNNTPPL